MLNKMIFLFFVLSLITIPVFATRQSITVQVPKTAYVQWLSTPSETMSQVSDATTHFEFQGEEGQIVEDAIYLGIMCNSLSGYEIRFIAGGTLGPQKAQARGPGGQLIPYKASLHKEASSFMGGSNVSTHLDLQGSSSSIRVQFQNGHALPLKPYRPNVFRLSAKTCLPKRYRGTYRGRITAIISLP